MQLTSLHLCDDYYKLIRSHFGQIGRTSLRLMVSISENETRLGQSLILTETLSARQVTGIVLMFLRYNCPKGLLCRDLSNFVVRPSSSVVVRRPHSFWSRILQNMHARNSIRDQNRVRLGHFSKLRARKTIRMFHLPIPCLFPSISGVIQLISRIVVASAGKFERFLHNRSFGPPLPCGCNLVNIESHSDGCKI